MRDIAGVTRQFFEQVRFDGFVLRTSAAFDDELEKAAPEVQFDSEIAFHSPSEVISDDEEL